MRIFSALWSCRRTGPGKRPERITVSSLTYLRRRLQPKPPPNSSKSTTMRMIHPVVVMAPPSC
jgi:hypothetical protein